MIILIINLIFSTLFAFFSKNKKQENVFFLFLTILILSLISGFRYKVGTDFRQYTELFTVFSDSVNWGLKEEPLFQLFMYLLKKIDNNPQIFFLVTSLMINYFVIKTFFENSKFFWLSVYFYITFFTYYSTMNGVRQYMASAIMFSGIYFLFKKKTLQYFLLIAIAFLIHKSVLILIPIYFLARKPIESLSNKYIIIFFAIAMIFYQQFVDVLFAIMPENTYGGYETTFKTAGEGANFLRAVVWFSPVSLGYIYRDLGRKMMGRRYDIIFNMCTYGMLFMILATRHKYFARMAMYFDFYYLLLVPLIGSFFKGKRKIVTLGLMILFFAYSTVLLLNGEAWIYPFRMKFTLF